MSGGDLKPRGVKAPLGLLPRLGMECASAAMLHGVGKYWPNNWRDADTDEWPAYLHAINRHAAGIMDGELFDPESGVPHLGHIAAGAMIACHIARVGFVMPNVMVEHPERMSRAYSARALFTPRPDSLATNVAEAKAQAAKRVTTIYLDMDDVLADLGGGIQDLFGIPKDQRVPVTSWDGIPASLSEALGWEVTSDHLWGAVADEGAAFWADLAWCEHGQKVLEVCQSIAPVMLMSTPTDHPSCAAGKVEWIGAHIAPDKGERRPRFSLTTGKHHHAHEGAVLIDDSQTNVERFIAHGGRAFLWPRPWNDYGRDAVYEDVVALRAFLTE